ncbi:alpha/beta hydrolase fold domain-containing protein [Nocardia fluminea]|uniref:alpha/beta hydrolase fold domain-containing protein n=1 Tax=Nocardia fluminea TaxID=134984 RepID=UPI000C708D0A|nr:alpha/beta hydrolase fold domain-containing protein [Nocardia fluminea]
MIAGASAGGGLAAGTTLLSRDHNGPTLAGQVLTGPMLDHRNDSPWSQPHDRPAPSGLRDFSRSAALTNRRFSSF